MKTFDAQTPEQWRKWLAGHHDAESEVWLVFHKRHTARATIAYGDAVNEALCYGWVDSLIKRHRRRSLRPQIHAADGG